MKLRLAIALLLLAGCSFSVNNSRQPDDSVRYQGYVVATSVTSTTVTLPTTVTVISAGDIWLAGAEKTWTKILGQYAQFIEGQNQILEGHADAGKLLCISQLTAYNLERPKFWPIPRSIDLDARERARIENMLDRFGTDASICIHGSALNITQDYINQEQKELVLIAKSLDRIGADR